MRPKRLSPNGSARVVLALRRKRRSLLVFGGYLVLSLWLWRSLVPHLSTHTLGGGLQDPGLFIWWFKWTPYALTHGMNPFRSTYLDAPVGISSMWNTSVFAVGTAFTPVTLIFGAVTSFNLACILGPPLSAWTAWLWLRRYGHDAAAAIGGLVFGFSPFVIAESRAGHLMFTWLFLVPIIVMLVEDLLWRSDPPLWPKAVWLGVVVAVQLLIGAEALLITVIGCAGLAIAVAVLNPSKVGGRLRVLAPAAGIAIAVGALLSAWPLFEMFGGGRVDHATRTTARRLRREPRDARRGGPGPVLSPRARAARSSHVGGERSLHRVAAPDRARRSRPSCCSDGGA